MTRWLTREVEIPFWLFALAISTAATFGLVLAALLTANGNTATHDDDDHWSEPE